MAEGEASHNRMKEGYKQEALEQLQINTEEAQIIIQQAQQQAQQEACQYVGSVVNYAEQAHIDKLREGKSKTEQAEKQTKKSETSEHILFIKMSEHQIIEQSQSREQELHQRKALVNYRHFPLESQHLEVNINQNMIILNRNTSLTETKQVDHQILKDHNQKQKQKQKPQVLDKRPSQTTKHNQLHLHMVLRRARIDHGGIGEKSKPKHISLIN